MISTQGRHDTMLMEAMCTLVILEKACPPATKAPICSSREGFVCIASMCVGEWVGGLTACHVIEEDPGTNCFVQDYHQSVDAVPS